MKAKLIIVLLCVMASFVSAEAKGFLPIIYSSGEHLVKVKDLPQEDIFTIEFREGQPYHVDLGIKHDQFSLFWVPLFNYGKEEYVLYTDKKIGDYDYSYVPLTSEDVDYIRTMGIDIPKSPKLPFWDVWGGKLLVVVLIGLLILIGFSRKQTEED